MQVTNRHNMPRAFYEIICKEIYEPDPKLLRVSELINPPLQKTLLLKHWDEIEVDVSDFLTTFLGTCGHYVLSQIQQKAILTEHTMKVAVPGTDITLKGTADLIDPTNGILVDYKFPSVFSYIFGQEDGFKGYTEQLNCYAWLARMTKTADIQNASLNMVLRDWQVSKKQDTNYPNIPFARVPIQLWGHEAQTDFINMRLHVHQTQQDTECSPDEKWQKQTTYAIMEKGRKSALAATYYKDGVRVPITSQEEAMQVVKARKLSNRLKSGTVYIEKRPGKCVKCSDWCLVRSVCPYRGE